MTNFNELLFTELRVIPVTVKDNNLSDENLVRAMTDHENLITLGYCLKPEDIVKLSKTEDYSVYETVKNYVEKVKADPMYPDFPTQVMEMDEAVFRFHQFVHYFSTYGMEHLFGIDVKKGWMPETEKTKKTKKQDIVLPSKTVSLIEESEKYQYVLKKLLGKRERLTIPEKELVSEAARNVEPAFFKKVPIAFKENLMDLFVLFFDQKENEVLFSICQHTGDVLMCLRYLLTKHHYRLSTSEKKRAVKLIERYPIGDFKTNLILSNKKAKNSFLVLDYLSYNKFSRSLEHKKAVKDFRDGTLRSWASGLKKLIFHKDEHVLPYISTRPGMLVRTVAWLIRLGYSAKDISEALVKNAKSLSVQTLVTILNRFESAEFSEREEREGVCFVIRNALAERLKYLDTPLKGKKVFVDEGIYSLDSSRIEANEKSEEGGYIRSGLTFKIPEAVKILRFFVYWNDDLRVDVDLHSYGEDIYGNDVHVGWNDAFKSHGIYTSGDITHSDAAEYVDIDLNRTDVGICRNKIHLYSGKSSFGEIDTCFVGMMGISEAEQDVELYSPANCFFYHNLKGNTTFLDYALIEPQNRLMQVLAKPSQYSFYSNRDSFLEDPGIEAGFSVNRYLDLLFEAQETVRAKNKEDADLVLRLDKGADICLIDENYYMDA